MGAAGAIALTRGTGEAQTRRIYAVIAVVAVIAIAAAAGLSQRLAGPTPAAGAAAGALQLSAVTPADLRESQRLGAQDTRFWASRAPGGATTVNAAQHLTAAYTSSAAELTVPHGQVGFSLVAVGRAGRLNASAPAVLTSQANRVTYAHGRHLSEWYANGPLGLEQGLRLTAPPSGRAAGPLTFAYELSGAHIAQLTGNSLSFRTLAGQPLLRYSGLSAVDARGRPLTAHLQLRANRLLIEIRDAGARYPITVDPLFTSTAQPRVFMSPLVHGAAALLLSPSSGPTLSITPVNPKIEKWSAADEGTDTLEALFKLTNPADHASSISNIIPGPVLIAPPGALATNGLQKPPTPSGGFSSASGQDLNYGIPYRVTSGGTASIGESISWHNDATGTSGATTGAVSIPLGSTLSGTVTLAADNTKAIPGVPLTVTGTNSASGAAVSKTTVSDATGKYKFILGPGTYQVQPSASVSPTAVGSADCTASGGACTVSMSQDRTANFTIDCVPTLDFHTSMVATGCFQPKDLSKGEWKAKGEFRMDGIDFKSPDDSAAPVIFNDQEKTIEGNQVQMSLTAPGYGGGWFAFYVPGGMHLAFPTSDTLHQWVFSTPWKTPAPGALTLLNGYLGLAHGQASTTLFGFPAHAPAFEVEFTPGQTVLTGQLSFPSSSDAWLDPVNGLWKTGTAEKQSISYPNAFKARMVANNTDGVSTLEGTFSPAAVFGINTETKRPFYQAVGKPPASVIELAKLGIKWELGQGLWHLIGTFVIHAQSAPQKALFNALIPLGFVIGRTVVNVDVPMRFQNSTVILGQTIPLPTFTGLTVNINSINEPIPELPSVFWQRAGFQIGVDDKNPTGAYLFGLNAGFSWLPRFKHDRVWFQELASIDAAGTTTLSPFSFGATADMKILNATILHGTLKWNDAGMYLEGDGGFNLQQVLRGFPFTASVLGKGQIWMPTNGVGSYVFELNGTGEVYHYAGKARFVLTDTGVGVCVSTRDGTPHGAYYDGGYHIGGCSDGPFTAAINVGATTSAPSGGDTRGGKDSADIAAAGKAAAKGGAKTFTLSSRSHVSGVSIHGAGAAPQLKVTGPGGLNLSVTKHSPTAKSGAAILTINPSDQRTYLLFLHTPRRGTYHLSPLHGSAAIRWVDFAPPLPKPSVRGSLHTVGCQHKLAWRLRRLPGQTVRFVDRTGKGQTELKTTSAAKGSLTVKTPTAASGRHTIVAIVLQQGTPRGEIIIAHYGAPTGTDRVTGLKAKRKGTRTTVGWKPVCAASLYGVVVTAGKTSTTSTTKRTSVVLTGKGKRIVRVTAVNFAGQTGKPSTITIH